MQSLPMPILPMKWYDVILVQWPFKWLLCKFSPVKANSSSIVRLLLLGGQNDKILCWIMSETIASMQWCCSSNVLRHGRKGVLDCKLFLDVMLIGRKSTCLMAIILNLISQFSCYRSKGSKTKKHHQNPRKIHKHL